MALYLIVNVYLQQSYGRAVELDNSRIFALVESGNISLMLGSFRKVRHYTLLPFLLSLFVVLFYFHVYYSNLLHF